MEEYSDYNVPHVVWAGLVTLFRRTQRYMAAMCAYREVYENINNEFLDLSIEAIWDQLISELTKIYDKESTCGSDNCSMKRLYNSCIVFQAFPDGKDNVILKQIVDLYECYDLLISKELRNKKIAHFDLEAVFTQNPKIIRFSDVEKLVNDTANVLAQVGLRLLGVEMKSEYLESVKTYKDNLLSLYSKVNICDKL